MFTKANIQFGGAVMSALYTTFSLVYDAQGWAPNIQWQYHALGGFVVFIICMVWLVVSKQREISELKDNIRLIATARTIDVHMISPHEAAIHIVVDFEIWVKTDIHTSGLILNIVSSRLHTPMWKIWKILKDYPPLRRSIGIRAEGDPYLKSIRCSDPQPFKDTATFKWVGDEKLIAWSPIFYPELALDIAMPKDIRRVFLDKELYTRGLKPL
jgi:hypothetical protein